MSQRKDALEAPSPPRTADRPRRLEVRELLGDAREAIIEHEGQEYRLRITANRKLILTK